MTSKRLILVAGGLLAGTLLLVTAGLVAAQDPTGSPQPGGSGMMGGQGWQGMMGGALDAETLEQMQALHDSMARNGTVDWAQMQKLHDQMHGTVTPKRASAPTR
jgi:Spy/CpxP family protein refolding chaperone